MKIFNWLQQRLTHNLTNEVTGLRNRISVLERKIKAWQDVDMNYHGEGYIVLVARMGRQHLVKVYPIKPHITVTEYKDIMDIIGRKYYAPVRHLDAPIDRSMIIDGTGLDKLWKM